MSTPQTLAAIDLGSNSFRMVIARVVQDELQLIDRAREGVRLAAALDDEKRLTPEGRQRALECLRKFGQRLRGLPDWSVRAVGTNTLRKARNTSEFVAAAQAALGHRIEVVSGQEEARLIFLGVAHSLSGLPRRRLVVDIGGGSTECIIGESFEPRLTESMYMGCVSYTHRFFPGGDIESRGMDQAIIAARLELQAITRLYRESGWNQCVGSSGTIRAVGEILHQNGWSEQGITPEGLGLLKQAVLRHSHVDSLEIPGLRSDRAQVLPGGLAILTAIFEGLRIERMQVASGGMREGLLYDLLGRIRHEDARDRTIQRFLDRYHVDREQARRVENTALGCLDQVAEDWDLDIATSRHFLSWAAQLHEIGLIVAHGGFHKHGAYLVAHSDMPGFSWQDQKMLGLLIRGHRRKIPKALLRDLPPERAQLAMRLCAILRLAILLNRGRSSQARPPLRLSGTKQGLRLRLPKAWLESHPLTRADLKQEASYLQSVGLKLKIRPWSEAASNAPTESAESGPL